MDKILKDMVDWLGVVAIREIITTSFDLYDRAVTPARLRGRTRYLLDFNERLEPFLGQEREDILNDDLRWNLEHHEQLQQRGEGHSQNGNLSTRLRTACRKARIALRRDELNEFIADVEKKQDNRIKEELIRRLDSSEQTIQRIDLKTTLYPCINLHAGAKLLSSRSVELGELPPNEIFHYVPLFQECAEGVPQPIWPLPQHAQQLFANDDVYAEQRFDVLLAVVDVLVIAARARWPHRRLSTTDIVIRYDMVPKGRNKRHNEKQDFSWFWKSTSSASSSTTQQFEKTRTKDDGEQSTKKKEPSSRSSTFTSSSCSPPIVKILNFRCPITSGCTDGCTRCRNEFLNASRIHGPDVVWSRFRNCHSLHHPLHHPFSRICFADAFGPPQRSVRSADDGINADRASLASFVLWLYTGVHASVGFNPFADEHAATMARVPWPLRFIITDYFSDPGRGPSMYSAQPLLLIRDFLHALKERRILPHLLKKPLVPPESVGQLTMLRAAAFRSTLVGAQTDEPEAALHFGMLLEQDAIINNEDNNCQVDRTSPSTLLAKKSAACTAYGFFACSARFGEPVAYLRMARLQAEWMSGTVPGPDPFTESSIDVGVKVLLRFLLHAAFAGVSRALNILEHVPDNGVLPTQVRELFRIPEHVAARISHDGIDDLAAESGDTNNIADIDEDFNQNATCTSRMESTDFDSDDTVFKLGNAILEIAKCWRRGTVGLPTDLEEARSWLTQAVSLTSRLTMPVSVSTINSIAKLELALLERQESIDPDSLRRAVDLMIEVSECNDISVRNDAMYWLGRWHHHRLIWYDTHCRNDAERQEVVIIENDDNKAAMYFRNATESSQPNKHAMTLLSRFHFLGLGGFAVNKSEGFRLNELARNAGSMGAYCRYALDFAEQAAMLYKRKLKDVEESGSFSSDDADNVSTTRLDCVHVIEGNPNSSSDTNIGQAQPSRVVRRARDRARIISALSSVFSSRQNNGPERGTTIDSISEVLATAHGNSTRESTPGTSRSQSHSDVQCAMDRAHSNLETRYEVDKLFRRAKNVLVNAINHFLREDPEEGHNPLPYLLVGRLIIKNLYEWTHCSRDVIQKKIVVDLFVNYQRKEAKNYLRKAALMYRKESWKKYRVNYIEQDRHWMEDAKRRYEREFHSPIE